jgi:hypothetical protein
VAVLPAAKLPDPNGKKVGEGKVDATLTNVFSADDGCDVGEDTGAPISPDYGPQGNAFNGKVKGAQLAIAEAAERTDHLFDPEPFETFHSRLVARADVGNGLHQ